MDLNKINSLKELNSNIKNIITCDICKNITNYVCFKGSSNPKVLFIGEAPGREEDLKGVPFCGRAGKLLDSWISKLNLREEDYAITNVVKCRPPNNRRPTKEEIEHCMPFLKKEIELMKPEKIVVLGKTATVSLLGEEFENNFMKRCGNFFGNIYILPHPAYCLRNPAYAVPLGGFKI